MQIDLIQPRHTYAPPVEQDRIGHIYLPTSLLTIGSRLLQAGVDVTFHDENFRPRTISSRYVGSNLLGSPYVPQVIRLHEDIARETQQEMTFFIGGQVVSGLSPQQLERLFGASTHSGNNDENVARILDLDQRALPSSRQTSLIPAYEKIDDESMKEYLSREISLYVSQGCKFACDFCAAVRTTKDPTTGEVIKIKEEYRNPLVVQKDVEYLVSRAKILGIDKLQIYMSNLDVFQTPHELVRFANGIKEIRKNNPDFEITLRGLATIDSFLRTRDKQPPSIEALVEAGFNAVGFGIDGMTPQIWQAVKKGHNTKNKCLEAIRSARQDLGITPEVLMVFGHNGIDTPKTLQLAYEFTMDMVERYQAVPRPHVAKAFVPGNEGWISPDHAHQVEALMQHPESFQSLDFTALPSPLTHPNKELRRVATEYFLKMCDIPTATTLPIMPITPDMTNQEIELVMQSNMGKYDR
ncbi:radical SAM protein [Candidatus Woesearchaeota archaeon]|nr:radical SAM protein [Candidatus Woesearchaeota archaeon]